MPQFKVDINKAVNGLVSTQERVKKGIEIYGKTAALKLESYCKHNAPWTDRTSNARQTLKGVTGWGGVSADIKLENTGKSNNYGEKVYVKNVENMSVSGTYADTFVIAITGNMSYSPSLELLHKKRYAILYPAVNAMQAEILEGFGNMMNNLR